MSESNSTKKCTKCKKIKLASGFYRDARIKSGLKADCKACCRLYDRSEAGRLKQARHRKTEKFKLSQAKHEKTERRKRSKVEYRKSDAGKLSNIKGVDKYKSSNPLKIKAHSVICVAIHSGRMENPGNCSECKITGKAEAHHDDYSLPLDVRWLCRKCHIAWHRENGPGLNG